MSNKKILLPIIIILVTVIIFVVWKSVAVAPIVISTETTPPHVVINNKTISVIIADELQEQWQGLSDRESMEYNNGMLFIFPDYEPRTFVMRRMHFALDILFIKDNKIIDIYKNLAPEGESPTGKYSSSQPVNYVLELNGDFTNEFGIKIGDEVEYSL